MGTPDSLGQGLGVPDGKGLTGVEDIADVETAEMLRIIDHVIEVAGADYGDGVTGVEISGGEGGGVAHSAGVESCDLVVGHVGDDVGASGGFLFNDMDGAAVQALVVEPLEVGLVVTPDGSNDGRVFAEEPEGVGDIAGGAAGTFDDAVDGEADVNQVELVGHDVVGKAAREVHDAVVGEGAGDEDFQWDITRR